MRKADVVISLFVVGSIALFVLVVMPVEQKRRADVVYAPTITLPDEGSRYMDDVRPVQQYRMTVNDCAALRITGGVEMSWSGTGKRYNSVPVTTSSPSFVTLMTLDVRNADVLECVRNAGTR